MPLYDLYLALCVTYSTCSTHPDALCMEQQTCQTVAAKPLREGLTHKECSELGLALVQAAEAKGMQDIGYSCEVQQ